LNRRGDGVTQIPKLVLRGFGESAGSWHVDRHPRVLGDVTGDGRADLVGFGPVLLAQVVGQRLAEVRRTRGSPRRRSLSGWG
jgi:hypothetical protein